MNIFNSLGSNYDFSFILKTLFASGDNLELKSLLENKYKGKVLLVYKARQAIELALKMSNLPSGSFVAINGFTCFALYDAIKKANLSVEYLDIEKEGLNFSSATLEKAIKNNPKIKAVIIQNTLGFPSDLKNISKICRREKLILIEDLAHSIGTKYSAGLEAGMIGDFVVLSFSQDKIVDGVSGGALISRKDINISLKNISMRKQIRDRIYPLFTYIIRKSYPLRFGKILHFVLKNLRLLSGPMEGEEDLNGLPNWYCQLINYQFKRLNNNLNHRKIIASIYSKLINPKVLSDKLVEQINLSSNLRFPIFVNNREALIRYLAKNGVYISDIWYDAPIAPKKYLSQTDYRGQCPNSQKLSYKILNLPTHIGVKENDAERISNLINL